MYIEIGYLGSILERVDHYLDLKEKELTLKIIKSIEEKDDALEYKKSTYNRKLKLLGE